MSGTSEEPSRVTASEFEQLIRSTIPLSALWPMRVAEIVRGRAKVRLEFNDAQLRAGGTINGPSMMTLADTALYAAVLSCIGLVPLAVTSDLSIRFLSKPEPRALIGEARILRLGKRLAVGEIAIASEGREDVMVAHATGTYAIPEGTR